MRVDIRPASQFERFTIQLIELFRNAATMAGRAEPARHKLRAVRRIDLVGPGWDAREINRS